MVIEAAGVHNNRSIVKDSLEIERDFLFQALTLVLDLGYICQFMKCVTNSMQSAKGTCLVKASSWRGLDKIQMG